MFKGTIAQGLLIGALTLTVKAQDNCGYEGETLRNSCELAEDTCYVYQVSGTPTNDADLGTIAYACATTSTDEGVASLLTIA